MTTCCNLRTAPEPAPEPAPICSEVSFAAGKGTFFNLFVFGGVPNPPKKFWQVIHQLDVRANLSAILVTSIDPIGRSPR